MATGQLKKVFTTGEERRFLKNKTIYLFEKGGNPPDFFLIVDGYVGLFVGSKGTPEKLVVIYRPGCIFPLIKNQSDQVFRFVALTNCFVAREQRNKVISKLSVQGLIELMDNMSERIQMIEEMVSILSKNNSYNKILSLFLLWGKSVGERINDQSVIPFILSQTLIASCLGIRRETANRLLTKIQQQNLVLIKGSRYIVPSLSRISQIVNG